ncbi:MAG: preprotein translocase subunit SecE [Egibacteraceae bacterium]
MSKSDVERQASQPQPQPRQRTGPRQFLREVRGEMKRVAWPSRKEVASYSVVVLVTVSILIAFVFLLDSVFGRFVLWIFG